MRILVITFLWVFFTCASWAKEATPNFKIVGQIIRVEPDSKQGYNFPFFLYVPSKFQNLLILPNNSSFRSDDIEALALSAKAELTSWADLAESVSSVLLVPVFPRPKVDPPIYTHALSRSTLEISNGSLKRIDLQLIKMSEIAKKIILKKFGTHLKKKFYMFGFSASAMFVNRFTFMHPELVSAVAFGAPGGWPLVPLKTYKDKTLSYPIGILDLEQLMGHPIDLEVLKKVPMFAFIGVKDENDSVVFRDGFTSEQQDIVFSLFGKKPVERWPVAEKIYQDAGLKTSFKIYEGIGHGTNKIVHEDIINFFKTNSN